MHIVDRHAFSRRGTTEENSAVLVELRLMNRRLAAFTTRDMLRPNAISFLASVGFTPMQIAFVLGMNAVTVQTALNRARKQGAKDELQATSAVDAGDSVAARA